MHSTSIVAKTKMEDPAVQVGKDRGLTIGTDDNTAVPCPPPQPPPPQATQMTHPQAKWALSPHVQNAKG
jgi:hypothetical protein